MRDRPVYARSIEQTRFGPPFTDLGAGLATRAHVTASRMQRAVFGCRTAAWMHGTDSLPSGVDETRWPVEVILPRSTSANSGDGVRAYRWNLSPEEVTRLDGLPVTSPTRTCLDCMRCLPRLDAIGIVDQFLQLGVSQEELQAGVSVLDSRNARRLRSMLEVVDPASESPAESRCRCLIIDSGFPPPESQVELELPSDGRVRLDLGYRDYRLGLEYDGAEFHTVDDMHADNLRRQAIRDAGWKLIVVRASDVYGKPEHMLWQLRGGLLAAGWAPRKSELDRINRNINYIAMRCRQDRELWSRPAG